MLIAFTFLASIGRSAGNENLNRIFFSEDPIMYSDRALPHNHIQIKPLHSRHNIYRLTPSVKAHDHDDDLHLFELESIAVTAVVLCLAIIIRNPHMISTHQSAYYIYALFLSLIIPQTHALNVAEYILNESLALNQAIKVSADGFIGDPSSNTLYTISIYHEPHPYTHQERIALRFKPSPYNVYIAGHDISGHSLAYLKDVDLLISSDADDAILLDFKLTSTKWAIYSFGQRIPEYDYKYALDVNITKVVAEFMLNPVISIGSVTAAPEVSSNITGGFMATIIIFILFSGTANALCVYLFYWKFQRKETDDTDATDTTTKAETKELKTKEAGADQTTIDTEAEELKQTPTETAQRTDTTAAAPTEATEPVWNRYLTIIVPITFLLEDFAAIGLEDPEKTASVNIALVITFQFLSAMIISWCRECCTRSIPSTIVPKVLTIIMEYLFAIILISFCRYVGLAGFLIGGFTLLQVVSEIMSIIFEQETGVESVLPPCCKWTGLNGSVAQIIKIIDIKVRGPSEEDRQKMRAARSEERKGEWLSAMTIFMVLGIFFFLFGAIYVESGCFDDWFKYWWAIGMFMFDQMWDTAALDIWLNAAKWRKVLLIVQFAALLGFMLITTMSTTFAPSEGCEGNSAKNTFEMASGYVYVACLMLMVAACMKCGNKHGLPCY